MEEQRVGYCRLSSIPSGPYVQDLIPSPLDYEPKNSSAR